MGTVEESKGGGGTNDSDDEDVEAKQSEEAMLAFEMTAKKAQLKAMKKIAKKRAKAEAQQRAMEEEARLEKNRKEEAEAEESRKKAAAEAEALEAQRVAQEQAERKEKMRQEAMSGVSEEMAKSDTAESALPAVRRKDKVVVKKRALMKVKGAAKLIGSLKQRKATKLGLGEVAGVYGSIAAPKGFGEKAVHGKDNSRAKDAKETTTHADGQISDNKAHDSTGKEDTYDEKVAAEEERLKTTVKLIDTVEESKGGGGTNDSDDEDVEAKQSEEAMLAFEMAARKAQLKAMKKIAKKRAKAEAQQRAMEEEARLEKNRKEEAEAEESRKKAAAEAEALEAQRIAQEQAERKEKMRQEAMSGVSEEMAKSDTAESALPAVRRKDKVVVKKRALMKVKGAAKLIGSLKRSAHERHANRQPKAAAGKESDNRRDIKEDDATGRNGESLDVEINRQIPKNTRKTGEGHADRTAKSAAIFLASPAGKKNRKR